MRVLAILALVWTVSLRADDVGAHYPKTPGEILAAARQEKNLEIYSVVHSDVAVQDLLASFRKRYPFIEVINSDDDGASTYKRFTREIAHGKPSADFIWSSAMDLQEKLINDGLSLPYESPEISNLPAWAHWQNLGYGVTLEPIALVYNRHFLSNSEMPRTHAQLREFLRLQAKRLSGRVAVYNPETSEVGMLLLSQDVRITRDSWELFDAFGKAHAHVYDTSRDMLVNILKGNQWIGYDVIASYALEMQKAHPELQVIFPDDYTLVMSRVAFVTANAKHPNAAKLFLDFLLSKEGQNVLQSHGMGPVRTDMAGPHQQSYINPVRTQAIRIGPGLLSGLDSLVRAQFLRRWRESWT